MPGHLIQRNGLSRSDSGLKAPLRLDEAVDSLQYGDVAVIAGHSGTLYTIMEGMGIDTTDGADFPYKIDSKGKRKVREFGDVWKVVIKNCEAKLIWRKTFNR